MTPRLQEYLREGIEIFKAYLTIFDIVVDGYRRLRFKWYAKRLQDRDIDFINLSIGVRSRRPAAIVQPAAFLLNQKEHRYYVEASIGDAKTYRQEIGPTFYSFPDKPAASRSDCIRAAEGERKAKEIRDIFEEILIEMGFDVDEPIGV